MQHDAHHGTNRQHVLAVMYLQQSSDCSPSQSCAPVIPKCSISAGPLSNSSHMCLPYRTAPAGEHIANRGNCRVHQLRARLNVFTFRCDLTSLRPFSAASKSLGWMSSMTSAAHAHVIVRSAEAGHQTLLITARDGRRGRTVVIRYRSCDDLKSLAMLFHKLAGTLHFRQLRHVSVARSSVSCCTDDSG